MEKMDEDDVIIFSCATITLACALEIQKSLGEIEFEKRG